MLRMCIEYAVLEKGLKRHTLQKVIFVENCTFRDFAMNSNKRHSPSFVPITVLKIQVVTRGFCHLAAIKATFMQ